MLTIQTKRGDTFLLYGTFKDNADGVVDLTGYTISSKVVTMFYQFKWTITCTIEDAKQGKYALRANTSAWTAGVFLFDIEFVAPGGASTSSDMIRLEVLQDATL